MKKRTIAPDTVVKAIKKDRIFRELDGESIILNIQTGAYCGLNAVGTRIWRIIQQPVSVTGIQDALLKEYNVDRQRCEKETLAFLDKMFEMEIAEVHLEKGA